VENERVDDDLDVLSSVVAIDSVLRCIYR
jgi:hypothetical protein